MVKGVSRSSGASSGSSAAPAPQQLPTMQTGQNVHDPLTQLNSHQGFGLMAGLNPFGDMGVNPNDPNMVRVFLYPCVGGLIYYGMSVQMQSMLNSPQFMQQMSTLMNNPAIVDQVIASNPQLAAMGPRVREAFQDEGFRQMMYVFSFIHFTRFSNLPLHRSNPETLQQMLRMASAFGGPSPFGAGGYGGFGSPFGAPQPAFPAPGTPNTNPASPASPTSATTPPTSAPAGSPPLNPFLFGAPPSGAGGYNPALMQQMLAASHSMGQGASAAGGWGGFGAAGYGMGTPPVPVPSDTRPPEERFQVQLQVSLFHFLSLFFFRSLLFIY